MTNTLRVALLIGAALALSASAATTPCTLTLTPEQVRGASYKAALSLSPGCPTGTGFRVRKSSTLNVARKGAPYQPIKPDGTSAYGNLFSWTVTKAGSNIPRGEEWTLLTWEWQRYHAGVWNARTQRYGVWQRIPSGGRP